MNYWRHAEVPMNLHMVDPQSLKETQHKKSWTACHQLCVGSTQYSWLGPPPDWTFLIWKCGIFGSETLAAQNGRDFLGGSSGDVEFSHAWIDAHLALPFEERRWILTFLIIDPTLWYFWVCLWIEPRFCTAVDEALENIPVRRSTVLLMKRCYL